MLVLAIEVRDVVMISKPVAWSTELPGIVIGKSETDGTPWDLYIQRLAVKYKREYSLDLLLLIHNYILSSSDNVL